MDKTITIIVIFRPFFFSKTATISNGEPGIC